MIYRFTFAALTELKQAALRYDDHENGLGGAFLDEIDATIVRILSNPLAMESGVRADQTMSYALLSIRTDLSST